MPGDYKPPRRRTDGPAQRPARSRDVARKAADRVDPRTPRTQPAGPKRWGKVARHGAGTLSEDQETASSAWRDAMGKARLREKPPSRGDEERWVSADPKPRKRKGAAIRRDVSSVDVQPDLAGGIRGKRLNDRLAQAAKAYERDRYIDARQILKTLIEAQPTNPAVRELYGLTLYRLGRYRDAAKEIRTYIDLTGSYDQHPVLADCYRALKRWKPVDELWEDLRKASPSAEVVVEGRIVTAGAMADRGDLTGAIELLEQARAEPKRPRDHHLRLWYALADLYERAGDVPKARRLFRRIADHDPEFFDVTDRARGVG
jgi:tetratricopeptide (TPR) repeat protein